VILGLLARLVSSGRLAPMGNRARWDKLGLMGLLGLTANQGPMGNRGPRDKLDPTGRQAIRARVDSRVRLEIRDLPEA